MSGLRGQMLVSTPPLTDPNFDRTVVLVIEHGEEGALGVVLTRPTDVAVKEILPFWGDLATEPPLIFSGGPVGEGSLIAVGRQPAATRRDPDPLPDPFPDSDAGTGNETAGPLLQDLVHGDLMLVDLEHDPDEVAVTEIRVFHGYAGWSAGQLDREVEAGGWFVLDPRIDDVLTESPERLWRTVLRRQGGRLAVLSYHPPDLHAH